MDGIAVAVHGDERMGEFFSLSEDEVFRACIDPRDIVARICDGASVGFLSIRSGDRSVRVSRTFPSLEVADGSRPRCESYSVMVTLVGYQDFADDERIHSEYENWLDLFDHGIGRNRFCRSYGESKDIMLEYQLRPENVEPLLRRLRVGLDASVEVHGDIQELQEFKPAGFDLAGCSLRFGFRGLYSVYSDSQGVGVTNYPFEAYDRFCKLVDCDLPGILASVGRRRCSFRCKDGSITRTLGGNRFDVYRTKTRRTVSIGFEQYADEDPPVRLFSGGVRKQLAGIGIKV